MSAIDISHTTTSYSCVIADITTPSSTISTELQTWAHGVETILHHLQVIPTSSATCDDYHDCVATVVPNADVSGLGVRTHAWTHSIANMGSR